MNKYKIEFKQTFKKEITIFAEDENEAMDIVEKAYLKTDLLDNSYRDLTGIETKIIEKNDEKVEQNIVDLEENQITLDKEDIEYLEELAEEMVETLEGIEETLEEMEEIIEEMGEILEDNNKENI